MVLLGGLGAIFSSCNLCASTRQHAALVCALDGSTHGRLQTRHRNPSETCLFKFFLGGLGPPEPPKREYAQREYAHLVGI